MSGDLLAVSGHLHLGLGVLVDSDGEVQPDVEDGEEEEEGLQVPLHDGRVQEILAPTAETTINNNNSTGTFLRKCLKRIAHRM